MTDYNEWNSAQHYAEAMLLMQDPATAASARNHLHAAVYLKSIEQQELASERAGEALRLQQLMAGPVFEMGELIEEMATAASAPYLGGLLEWMNRAKAIAAKLDR